MRLTPEREQEIANTELPKGRGVTFLAELLDEINALRIERDAALREREAEHARLLALIEASRQSYSDQGVSAKADAMALLLHEIRTGTT